jgi:hypothetical protein
METRAKRSLHKCRLRSCTGVCRRIKNDAESLLTRPTSLDMSPDSPGFLSCPRIPVPGFHILHHHESFDGKGYPAGLKNSEIPLASRIVSVTDAFDAMVSSRPYRQGLPFEEAIRRLILGSGTQFDPAVVQSFLPLAQAEMETVFAAAGTEISAAL